LNSNSLELLDLFLQLDEREGLQYAYISIRPNTRISNPADETLVPVILERIFWEIEEQGIIHGLRPESELQSEIRQYLQEYKTIQTNKTFFTFLAAQPTLPIRGDDGSLEVLIDLKLKPGKIKDPKTGQIDYHDLGFSETLVRTGDPLVVTTHATAGIDGTDIFGEPIKAKPGNDPGIPRYDRRTIIAEEEEFITREQESEELRRRTSLKARLDGFLYHDSDRGYFIDKDVLTQQVDFHTGNIEVQDFTEIDSIIKVSGSSDILHDSVKPGFTLKAREIFIDGNVGRGAILEGDRIIISGIVDAKAQIRGQEIEIHKVVGARIEGEKIRINQVLQNASVCGHEILLKTCVSSEIIGEEVFISNELRASRVTAASFIYCHKATGPNFATLTIDPPTVPSFSQALEEQRELVENMRRNYRDEEQKLHKKQGTFRRKHQPRLDNFFKVIEGSKSTRLNQKQRQALEQMLRHGRCDAICTKLNLDLNKLIRQQLDEFSDGCKRFESDEKVLGEHNLELQKEESLLKEMENAHTQGLILISGESNGEIKVCYCSTCLSPVVFNQKLLFCFDNARKRIVAMKKFGSAGHRNLYSHLSPRALATIKKFV
jgi:uncharacterized protein (DUF342 family)